MPSAALLAMASIMTVSGCYRGEWRAGAPVPVSSKARVQPTRDVERWEIEPTTVPYVVRVRAELVPRCRSALYGTTRRTDTGRFVRTGAGYWKAGAVTAGALGGAATFMGGSAWLSRDAGQYARPSMYAVGGSLALVGLINCFLSIHKGSKARHALCGSMLGAGGAVIAGAALSQPEVTRMVPDPMNPMLSVPMTGPLVQTEVWKGMVIGGSATLGVALASGIIGALWKGEQERQRVVEEAQGSAWDDKGSEQVCGSARPLTGRTATLEIIAENVTEGPGSEAAPLKLPVVVGDEGKVVVDLRPMRQALPECGVLRVQLTPDTLYEEFSEDYVPPGTPSDGQGLQRPIHGQVVPEKGLTLKTLEGRRRATKVSVPNFSEDVIGGVARQCKAELARGPRQGPVEAPRAPVSPVAPVGPAQGPPEGDLPLPGIDDPEGPQPEVRAQGGGECTPEKRQNIIRDCEMSCSKSLEVNSCLFERRRCLIDARYSQQRQRDQELCELAWEQCLYKGGVGPGAWARCVEGCQKQNEGSLCR